ncbi:MAG: hypothetical protein HAW67_04355 [Endozoicomonadaceae bacterium]|nr:hypothetical protein [Endozoicomonadaceae bacterium]
MSSACFQPPSGKINHRLISRFVAMAGTYNWRQDPSVLTLRVVLKLRTYIRESFLLSFKSVTQALIYYCKYTPTKVDSECQALFVIPDEILVSTIARAANVSRFTVYRVLDYLSALGFCETHTRFIPAKNQYLPTKIFLKASLFVRLGMPFTELQTAIQSLKKHNDQKESERQKSERFIRMNIAKHLRPSVKRRLGAEAERILAPAVEPKTVEVDATFVKNPNFIPEAFTNVFRTGPKVSGIQANEFDHQNLISIDPEVTAIQKKGGSVRDLIDFAKKRSAKNNS